MPSNFSSIGFPVKSPEDLIDLAERLGRDAQAIETPRGRYHRWTSGSGAELWLQSDMKNQFLGINPHFAGDSVLKVGLLRELPLQDRPEMDGAFHAWADPEDGDPQKGSYPFVFDCPDFYCHSGLKLPCILDAQVAAFAHEIHLYASENDYEESQGDEPGLATESFIPSGLFTPEGDRRDPPQATAIITGRILETEKRTNDLTGEDFYWSKVKTFGGVFDVVVEEGLVTTPPSVGGVLSGSFWLSGRLRR